MTPPHTPVGQDLISGEKQTFTGNCGDPGGRSSARDLGGQARGGWRRLADPKRAGGVSRLVVEWRRRLGSHVS